MREGSDQAEIEDVLGSAGISVMGTAAARDLPSVTREFSPGTMLAGARSVISYGVPIPKGIVHADRDHLHLYWRYCNMLYRSLDMVSNRISVLLEERGHLACPAYGCYPWRVVDGEFWGLLPLVYWAEEAGLGRLTKCGLLAHPDYGTRILLGGVVTTMELPPTDRLGGEACPSNCSDCIEACPAGAIEEGGKVNHTRCAGHANPSPLAAHLLADPAATDRFALETIVNTVAPDDHAGYSCTECVKVCPLNST
jgi:epoxyqueuosine reductase QueG